ncbi:MAG: hypothetical protein KAQ64_02380 [Candidatus Pacebacteria bacterium]|nr:hypothetical protein [Candidatus Paceibacterota bacterium]
MFKEIPSKSNIEEKDSDKLSIEEEAILETILQKNSEMIEKRRVAKDSFNKDLNVVLNEEEQRVLKKANLVNAKNYAEFKEVESNKSSEEIEFGKYLEDPKRFELERLAFKARKDQSKEVEK